MMVLGFWLCLMVVALAWGLSGCAALEGPTEPTPAEIRAACAEHGGVRHTTVTGSGWVEGVTCLDGHYEGLR